jgi:ABC-type molybdate transport system ATPase subunit
MYVRLAFAAAVNVDPDILVIDEALAVGDLKFQNKCMSRMSEFKSKSRTILLVSHNLYTVRSFCDRCLWIKHGQIIAHGKPDDVVNQYMEDMQEKEIGGLQINEMGERVMRIGTGDVVITRANLLDKEGNEKSVFKTGDDVILEISYDTKERILRPTFAYSICTDVDCKVEQIRTNFYSTKKVEQIRITSYSTKWAGCSPPYIIGQGVVRVRLNSIPLLPGHYTFVFAIRDEYDVVPHDLVQDIISFKIVEGDDKSGMLGSCGLVYYPTQWDFLDEKP